jgi:hypothetical protein
MKQKPYFNFLRQHVFVLLQLQNYGGGFVPVVFQNGT